MGAARGWESESVLPGRAGRRGQEQMEAKIQGSGTSSPKGIPCSSKPAAPRKVLGVPGSQLNGIPPRGASRAG